MRIQTEDAKVVNDAQSVFVNLPLTKPTGKIRVKRRSAFYEYGQPVRPRQDALTQANYVEWQIGYDLLAEESNKPKTTSWRFWKCCSLILGTMGNARFSLLTKSEKAMSVKG